MTPCGEKPGLTSSRAARLRRNSPAPTRSTSASATSAITRIERKWWGVVPALIDPPPFLQKLVRLTPQTLPRRRDSEKQSCQHGRQHREDQHRRVEPHADGDRQTFWRQSQ